MESWSLEDTKEWLRLNKFPKEMITWVSRFHFDGNAFLDAEEIWRIQLKEWKKTVPVSFETFFKSQKDIQEALAGPSIDVEKKFPPHEIPSAPLEAVQFCHFASRNSIAGSMLLTLL